MEDKLTKFYRTIVKSGFYPSQRNLKFWLHNLFKDIDLQNKNILDIGGGVGVISLYAACSGARNVICLEPELAGSSKNLQNKFNILKQELIVYNVNFVSESFQNFNSD